MDRTEFLKLVNKRMLSDSTLRFGQTCFIILEEIFPEEAYKIRGTTYDPFHRDSNVERMFAELGIV